MYSCTTGSSSPSCLYNFVGLLFEVGCYSKLVSIQSWFLFKVGFYSKLVSIQSWFLLKLVSIQSCLPFKVRLLFEELLHLIKYGVIIPGCNNCELKILSNLISLSFFKNHNKLTIENMDYSFPPPPPHMTMYCILSSYQSEPL